MKSRIDWVHSTPFIVFHLLAPFAFAFGCSWKLVLLCLASYTIRMFGITAGYHRYFSHRSFQTSRVFQFLLAFVGGMSVQKGALWWASHHRHHHRASDSPEDLHSPSQKGFWWSHFMWFLVNDYDSTDLSRLNDFSKYPELVWLNEYHWVPGTLLGVALFIFGGWPAVFWGFFLSTVLLWHATFSINSLAHVFGKRRYETKDHSANNFWLAILTLGEGWHNNHHAYMSSTRQGFFWWEVDATYYFLRFFQGIGIVWSLREPPLRQLENRRLKFIILN